MPYRDIIFRHRHRHRLRLQLRAPAGAAALALTLLAGCGGGSSSPSNGAAGTTSAASAPSGANQNVAQITAVINAVQANPALLCSGDASAALIKQLAGPAACKRSAAPPNKHPYVVVHSVTVTGPKATASVTDIKGPYTAHLVKEGGSWKIATQAGQ